MGASNSARGRFLLVDGHSMIFAWDELRQLHEQRMSLAREALYACYGMAEATLFVSGARVEEQAGESGGLVPSGAACDDTVIRVVDPQSGHECPPGDTGEI